MEQALILGGSTGMGKATAELLLKKGIEVAIVAKDMQNLEIAQNELSGLGKVKAYAVDLANMQEIRDFGGKLSSAFPHLKYLVNAAGYFSPKSFLDHTEADFDTYHSFNKAFFFITQQAVHIMQRNGGGSIVNIGSMWARQAIKATPSSAIQWQKQGCIA